MNSIEAQRIATIIGESLNQPNPSPPVAMPLRETWQNMTDAEKARQTLNWMVALIGE